MRKTKKGARAARARKKNVVRSKLSQERLQAMQQGMRQAQLKRLELEQRLRNRLPDKKADHTGGGAFKMREACQYIGGIHSATMRRLIERGLIIPNRKLRHLTFSIAELDRFLTEGV